VRSSGQRVANRIGHLLDLLTRRSFIVSPACGEFQRSKKIAREKITRTKNAGQARVVGLKFANKSF
jgi:hypothetical protein